MDEYRKNIALASLGNPAQNKKLAFLYPERLSPASCRDNDKHSTIYFKNMAISKRKHPGKPPKFNSPKELEDKITAYFKNCWMKVYDKKGQAIKDPETRKYLTMQIEPYTMSGLANALDIDRKTLLNYQNKDEYFPTISRARRKVEANQEAKLFVPGVAGGAKFALANNFAGWNDEHTLHTPELGEQAIQKRIDEMTPEEQTAELLKKLTEKADR